MIGGGGGCSRFGIGIGAGGSVIGGGRDGSGGMTGGVPGGGGGWGPWTRIQGQRRKGPAIPQRPAEIGASPALLHPSAATYAGERTLPEPARPFRRYRRRPSGNAGCRAGLDACVTHDGDDIRTEMRFLREQAERCRRLADATTMPKVARRLAADRSRIGGAGIEAGDRTARLRKATEAGRMPPLRPPCPDAAANRAAGD